MKRWLALLIGALVSTATYPQQSLQNLNSAQTLLKQCKAALQDERATPDSFYCVAYLQGFREGMFVGINTENRSCAPMQATTEQVIRVVVKHLEDHPEILHHPKWGQVGLALARAFPCSK